jgi:hypothetical protein
LLYRRWEREPEKRVEEPIYVPSVQPQKRVSKFGAMMKSKLPPVEPQPARVPPFILSSPLLLKINMRHHN